MRSPLCVALDRGRTSIADKLKDNGATLSVYDEAWMGNMVAVRDAVSAGPDFVNRPHPADEVWETTPLHFAIAGNQPEVARFLCNEGADISAHEELFLDFAARRGSRDLLQLLFDHGARPSRTNVFSILSGRNLELVRWLSSQGRFIHALRISPSTRRRSHDRRQQGQNSPPVRSSQTPGAPPRNPLHR
ncbi:MAG: hypothetical protein CME26_08615 [Gemmatimonadetes bacterium]|nr:hypothetical protein [Gemmatimonadota bacterium]